MEASIVNASDIIDVLLKSMWVIVAECIWIICWTTKKVNEFDLDIPKELQQKMQIKNS